MRYLVTLQAADGRQLTVNVDARTMQGACTRAERRANRAESGASYRSLCVVVAPFGWKRS